MLHFIENSNFIYHIPELRGLHLIGAFNNGHGKCGQVTIVFCQCSVFDIFQLADCAHLKGSALCN
jgi:hypothetical protein